MFEKILTRTFVRCIINLSNKKIKKKGTTPALERIWCESLLITYQAKQNNIHMHLSCWSNSDRNNSNALLKSHYTYISLKIQGNLEQFAIISQFYTNIIGE